MGIPRRGLPVLLAAALLAAACGSGPAPTASPTAAAASPSAAPSLTEAAFAATAFPASGSACGTAGYTGRMGRIEAVDQRTVRFTLCAPDGAFLTRLAHPALSILDSTTLAALAANRAAGQQLAGTGDYRIERWVAGDNVLLRRASDAASGAAVDPVVALRWAADAGNRTNALKDASVDGMDAPGPSQLDEIATLPELVVTPRAGLATAYLAFGSGPAFAGASVRRAIAGSIDRADLTATAFPAGSVVPTHLTPCVVVAACGGPAWYEFNAPAGAAALAAAGFDLKQTYPLHVPDAPVPGLPDPAGVAAAIAGQLKTNLGMTVSVDTMPSADFAAAEAKGRLDGLYLDGIATSVPDPSAVLEPLFADGVGTTPARRASGIAEQLAAAAATPDPAARAAAFAAANSAIRSSAVIVPLSHPGSAVTFRSDVTGVVTSPLGLDPLGAAVPGDRPQLVFMQATEPAGGYCGDQATLDAYRLCGLVSEGLYGFAPGGLEAAPRLAQGCSADAEATVWTCRLAEGRTFSDGKRVDAADVLATFVAQWDASSALRRSEPTATFAAWEALFGSALGTGS